ncbi:MAG: hypothetical protein ACP5L3_07235 [Caldisericum sp.]|uniref:hypothetical protein n=1 Tax=Caldisericum sp. TaxID=2499687 RepID=UPI003D0D4A37
MVYKKKFSPKEFEEFFQSVGTVASGTKIFHDGVQYVDDASFWKWMRETVIKRDGLFDSAEAIRKFVTNKPKGSEILIQGRGMEWDWVRDFNDNPLNIGKSAKLATIADDRNGVDAFVRKLFGRTEKVQMKTALSDTGAQVNLSKYPDETKIVVNEKIAKWRENHPEILAEREDTRVVEQVYTDKQLEEATKKRMEQAKSDEAIPGVTIQGAIKQIGEGAIIGAVIYVGISALTNYSQYKSGIISGNEYANRLIKDSAKGALSGGSFAAINIPIQIAAKTLGVGMPVTIPVMIILRYRLKKIVDPLFAEGEYKAVLTEMNYTNDIAKGFASFAYISEASFEVQKHFLNEMIRIEQRAKLLNKITERTDDLLNKSIEEI